MVENIVMALATPVITGCVLYYWQRKQKIKDAETAKRAEARMQESLLSMKMTYVGIELAMANTLAIEQGHHNGELKAAKERVQEVKEEYAEFMRVQAKEHLA